jgi:hypothetical protein
LLLINLSIYLHENCTIMLTLSGSVLWCQDSVNCQVEAVQHILHPYLHNYGTSSKMQKAWNAQSSCCAVSLYCAKVEAISCLSHMGVATYSGPAVMWSGLYPNAICDVGIHEAKVQHTLWQQLAMLLTARVSDVVAAVQAMSHPFSTQRTDMSAMPLHKFSLNAAVPHLLQ